MDETTLKAGVAMADAPEVWLAGHAPLLVMLMFLAGLVAGLLWRRRRLLAQAAAAARLAQAASERRRAAAQVQAAVAAPVVVEPAREEPPVPVGPVPLPADFSRLPDRLPWVGRSAALARLDEWLADEQVAMVTLVAADGVGKTRLLRHWADRCGTERGLPCLYWSFAGGDAGQSGAAVRGFFEQVAVFFGPADGAATDGEALVERLWDGLRERPCLVLLDGLEPLAVAGADGESRGADPDLQALLRWLDGAAARPAVWQDRLVVCTARPAVGGPTGAQTGPGRVLALDNLKENEATQLLHELGVRGKFADFRPVVKALRGHALLLTLLGRLWSCYYQGSMANRERLALLWQPGTVEEQVERLLVHYETVIWPGDATWMALLRLSGMVAAPVALDDLQDRLRQVGLLLEDGTLHPLVQAGCARRLH
ncbi:MAG: hypothetical protein H7838_13955 [Magnetococcus sp. DMHC-8]